MLIGASPAAAKPRTFGLDMPPDRRKDPRRRAAVDIAIALAELNASWGDYDRALEHLRAAVELAGGSLAGRFAREREEWVACASGNATLRS